MGFSRQKYWSGLPFPSPVDHVLQNSPPWHVHLGWPLHRRAHSFTELDKAVVHVIRLASFLWLWFSVCLPSDGEGQEAYGSFLMGETEGLVLMGRAILSKFLIQFSVDGWGCVPSMLFDLRPNYGGDNEDNGDLLQKVPSKHCYTQCPQPCSRPPPSHASARDSWTLMGKSGSVSCGVTAPFSRVLVHTRFCLCPPRVCFPSPVSVLVALRWVNGNLLQEGLCHTQVYCTQSPCPCISPVLTRTSSGDTETQFCPSLCGVSGSWCA